VQGTATYYGNVFRVDWNNFEAVLKIANQLGRGQSIVKHADRENFNVTHTSRRDLIDKQGVAELYCTI
jgi:hypothetical protein